jgi:hypothetical protein
VGYRFNDSGTETGPLEIDTAFKDGAGNDCGRRHIRFLGPDLAIDNPNVGDILDLISNCAAKE